MGNCIKANKTITFALPKLGHFLHPGCEYVGRLVVTDIGIPKAIIDKIDIKTHIIDEKMAVNLIPLRLDNSSKSNYGKSFIITGSTGMTGSGYLAANAVLRTGSGLVYLGVPSSLISIYECLLAESVTIPLDDNNTGYITSNSINKILDKLASMNVVAIGPGLSINDDTANVVYSVIQNSLVPMVIDADALNAISLDVSVLKNLKAEAVITPHPGEMARLMGIKIKDVQNNRVEFASKFAVDMKVITVLKGSKTIIAFPDSSIYINPTGNSGMSTAGTGDILTGIITSFIAQGLSPRDAAILGVYIHGLSGDQAALEKGEHGLIAKDIVEQLPYAIKNLYKLKETIE